MIRAPLQQMSPHIVDAKYGAVKGRGRSNSELGYRGRFWRQKLSLSVRFHMPPYSMCRSRFRWVLFPGAAEAFVMSRESQFRSRIHDKI
jgi:hypothetical protein